MFKRENSESELFENMNSYLKDKNLESNLKLGKINNVIDLLNKASEIFENHKLLSQAESIVEVIKNISDSQKVKK